MSLTVDYPTETQQMKIIAAAHKLDDLRVYIPDEEDIDYEDDTMIIFSDTRGTGFQNVLEFSRSVGNLFRKQVYVSGPNDIVDTTAFLKAQSQAEII